MTIQKEYEKNGWNFDQTGGGVVVGRKNVILDKGKEGTVTVSSNIISIYASRSLDILYGSKEEQKNIKVDDFYFSSDSRLNPISMWLRNYLIEADAIDVGEDLDGIMRYGLVT